MCVVEKGYTGIINYLLNQPGIAINAKNADGETALDLTKKKNRRRIIRLIQSKVEPHGHHKIETFREETKHPPAGKIYETFWNAIF